MHTTQLTYPNSIQRIRSITLRDDLNGATASRKCMATYGRCYVFQSNRTQTSKSSANEFFRRWSTHDALLYATRKQIEEVIAPLGMRKVRAERIYRMSEQFGDWDGEDATELYGIGKYGS